MELGHIRLLNSMESPIDHNGNPVKTLETCWRQWKASEWETNRVDRETIRKQIRWGHTRIQWINRKSRWLQ